jgi:hypothetical protein
MQSGLSKNLMRRRFGFKPYLLQKSILGIDGEEAMVFGNLVIVCI